MVTKPKAKPSSDSISPTLQKLFVGASLLAFVMQIIQSAYFAIMQYNNNPNLSGFMGYYVGIALMLFVIIALYFSKKHKAVTLKNAFDLSVIAVSTVLFSTALSWLTMFVPFPVEKVTESFYWFVVAYQLLPLIVTLPLLVIAIRRLRAQNQW